MQEPLIDICIPTYNEDKYIYKTLKSLSEQNLCKGGGVNIIIGDYDPEENHRVKNIVKQFNYVTYVPIYKQGIGYARNLTIASGKAEYVVNFDADCHYNRDDALELLVEPLLPRGDDGAPEALLTHCDIRLEEDDKAKKVDDFANNLFNALSMVYRVAPVVIGPCMMFSREAFNLVGGFRELPPSVPGEDWEFVFRFCTNFSMRSKKWVRDVVVIASSRRHKHLKTDPFSLDYNRQYR